MAEGRGVVGKKLKLGGKGRGTAAEEGGVCKCIERRCFAHLVLVGGEEVKHMWWECN